ncbi:hypothetical protein QL285_055227 [Trifolium repens]|nr:hypothetical protein QL285_055227 [Trifolium repens]
MLVQKLLLQNLCPSEAMKVRICVESLVTIRSCLLQRLFASEAAELELQIQQIAYNGKMPTNVTKPTNMTNLKCSEYLCLRVCNVDGAKVIDR